jgi:hypothetical protein
MLPRVAWTPFAVTQRRQLRGRSMGATAGSHEQTRSLVRVYNAKYILHALLLPTIHFGTFVQRLWTLMITQTSTVWLDSVQGSMVLMASATSEKGSAHEVTRPISCAGSASMIWFDPQWSRCFGSASTPPDPSRRQDVSHGASRREPQLEGARKSARS